MNIELSANSSDLLLNNATNNLDNMDRTWEQNMLNENTVLLTIQNTLLILFLIGVALTTIIGNILVLLAIFVDFHLRSPTHYLMGSLATADLCLGILVLPFSSTHLYLDTWPFGHWYCEVWLATDVLLSTASIYLVLVISIDRYIGVTRPLRYNAIVTKRRMFLVIMFVWFISLLVSLAPQIGWKAPQTASNVCEVNNDVFYALFSASVSYYIPLIIILVVYFRVYQEAVKQMRFLKTGVKVMDQGDGGSAVTLRVHIGPSNRTPATDLAPTIHCTRHRHQSRQLRKSISMEFESLSVTESQNLPMVVSASHDSIKLLSSVEEKNAVTLEVKKENSSSSSTLITKTLAKSSTTRNLCKYCNSAGNSRNHSQKEIKHNNNTTTQTMPKIFLPPLSSKNQMNNSTTSTNFSSKIARFKREQKAAKTLGIVVGCLVICWMPFFLVLPLESFKLISIPKNLFLTIFWLGYCNSAMNPLIYAFSSREFRRAYKGILKCNLRYRNRKQQPQLKNVTYTAIYRNRL